MALAASFSWVLAQEELQPLTPDSPLYGRYGGETCFFIQTQEGIWSREGVDVEGGTPFCIKTPRSLSLYRLEMGDRVFYLHLAPRFSLGETPPYLVIYESVDPSAQKRESSPPVLRIQVQALEASETLPLGKGGITNIPELQGDFLLSSEGAGFRLAFVLEGAPLQYLDLADIFFSYERSPLSPKTALLEAGGEGTPRSFYGGVFLPSGKRGQYELRLVLRNRFSGEEVGWVRYAFLWQGGGNGDR